MPFANAKLCLKAFIFGFFYETNQALSWEGLQPKARL